jgi:hypothetical protein
MAPKEKISHFDDTLVASFFLFTIYGAMYPGVPQQGYICSFESSF